MENSAGEAVDDQGSGWLQVKKKHRSSSKFFLQSWVGGLSGKHASNFQPPLTNDKSRKLNRKRKSEITKSEGSFSFRGQGGFKNISSVSHDDNKAVDDIHNFAAEGGECTVDGSFIADSNDANGSISNKPQIEKHNVVQKIRWGDLEPESSVFQHPQNVGAEIKFGNIEPDDLVVSRKHESDNCFISCASPNSNHQGNNSKARLVNVVDHDDNMNSLICQDQIEIEDCSNENIISSETVEIVTANEEIADQNLNALSCREISSGNSQVINEKNVDFSLPSEKEAAVDNDLLVNFNVGEQKISQVIVEDETTCAKVMTLEAEANDVVKSGLEVCGKSSAEASLCCSPLSSNTQDEQSKTQNINALSDDDSNESKERFRQRLWCFLFENLNRAVDELYLLCELECDSEQMKEATLVLEEAASDFKDLTSRVEEFEEVKKSSSQSYDGAAITLKTDHRRPHALSWEVRRMTNSPHKAEILSSSLEAFKKIQQERASLHAATASSSLGLECSNCHHVSDYNNLEKSVGDTPSSTEDSVKNSINHLEPTPGKFNGEQRSSEVGKSNKLSFTQCGHNPSQNHTSSDPNSCRLPPKDSSHASSSGKIRREPSTSESEKLLLRKEKMLTVNITDRSAKPADHIKRQTTLPEKDKEKRSAAARKSMDAWKEKRNWEDILSSPCRVSSRISHSPSMSRKSTERARNLRDKLMSPEKKKKTALDLKKEAEEKHARAMKIRSELEIERVQKLQRTSEKLTRVNEWQAIRNMKLREDMFARHQRSELRHEAFIAKVVRRAGDESSKVNEVRFITSLNEENKKLILRQKLQDSELRRAEIRQVLRTKQKEDIAREEAVLERRKLLEAEKLQRLAETQRKKEVAQVRREEERKASSAARVAKAIENLRRKEERAKAQQEEAELLAQKLAEKLSESEQRRKFYLEQIRERASMDFRDQSSPLLRRSTNNKDSQGRPTPANSEDCQSNVTVGEGSSTLATGNVALQHSLKRKIKKIRQRLMALKFEFPEASAGCENAGIGYRTAMATARAKIGRWLQELQKLRQARKEGASSIGLITAEMIKFLEGKDPGLHASRQAGLLDFIASALPASHTSKPEACQVTIHLLKLLRVVLSLPSNRSYFVALNLLPPIIPMLAAALENYIKIAASLNASSSTNLTSSKVSVENFETISEVLDGFLWAVTAVIGHTSSDERQLQMHDGLLELLVAYQVIHRLRDLFALYDRPQVEGSPFPSSILLSISLLVILTSSPGRISSIDWETSAVLKTVPENHNLEVNAVTDGFEFSYYGDSKISSSIPLEEVTPECLLDKCCKLSTGSDSEKKPDDSSVRLNDGTVEKKEVLDESGKPFYEKNEKPSVVIVEPQKVENRLRVKPAMTFLLSAISETGLVSLPSLLTSVLLQANNRFSSEQSSYILPSNFEEVATGVLKVLNNLALMDNLFLQRMLARPDLKMEFFHLMSFLLSHCSSNWKVATDQVGLLLRESLLLLGYFALFHSGNQAVLRWGKSPTILHKICDLPFVFFSDPELMPILASTLVAACYGCEQNKGVVQQELSMDMLLSLLKSCRNVLPVVQSSSTLENLVIDEGSEVIRKYHGDIPLRTNRPRTTRVSVGKGGILGNSMRAGKARNLRDAKGNKVSEDTNLKNNPARSTETSLMLHCRFPSNFVDKAEQFFSADTANLTDGQV